MQPKIKIEVPDASREAVSRALGTVVILATPKRRRKMAADWEALAKSLEDCALYRAGVYSIRDRGLMYGERPADEENLEVARLLRHFATQARRYADGEV